jgi:hypothetical protein
MQAFFTVGAGFTQSARSTFHRAVKADVARILCANRRLIAAVGHHRRNSHRGGDMNSTGDRRYVQVDSGDGSNEVRQGSLAPKVEVVATVFDRPVGRGNSHFNYGKTSGEASNKVIPVCIRPILVRRPWASLPVDDDSRPRQTTPVVVKPFNQLMADYAGGPDASHRKTQMIAQDAGNMAARR